MPRAGSLREELSGTLSTAYGRGLLSDHTYALRLGELLHEPLIDPDRLVGDLHLRHHALRERASRTMSTLVARIDNLFGEAAAQEPPYVLGLTWTGLEADMLVGRTPGCDVRLPDSTVSRIHARLRYRRGRWTLTDLHSRNGTMVNGRRVTRTEIRHGDDVRFGCFAVRID